MCACRSRINRYKDSVPSPASSEGASTSGSSSDGVRSSTSTTLTVLKTSNETQPGLDTDAYTSIGMPLTSHYAYRDIATLPSPLGLTPQHFKPSIQRGILSRSISAEEKANSFPTATRKRSLPENIHSSVSVDDDELYCDYEIECPGTSTLPRQHKQQSRRLRAGVRASQSVSGNLDRAAPPLVARPPQKLFSSSKDLRSRHQQSVEEKYEEPELPTAMNSKRGSLSRTQTALIKNFRRSSQEQLNWLRGEGSPSKAMRASQRMDKAGLGRGRDIGDPAKNGDGYLAPLDPVESTADVS